MAGRQLAGTALVLVGLGFITGGALLMLRSQALPAPPQLDAALGQLLAGPVAPGFQVPANHPKYLSVPALGLADVPVLPMGAKRGQVQVPASITDTGWYQQSSLPGSSGAMFLFGHVSNLKQAGALINLYQTRPGDTFIVTRGDGRTFKYAVNQLKTYPADSVDMHTVLSPVTPGRPGLNIMTCTGAVRGGHFTQRLVVFSTLEP